MRHICEHYGSKVSHLFFCRWKIITRFCLRAIKNYFILHFIHILVPYIKLISSHFLYYRFSWCFPVTPSTTSNDGFFIFNPEHTFSSNIFCCCSTFTYQGNHIDRKKTIMIVKRKSQRFAKYLVLYKLFLYFLVNLL